MSDLSMPDSGSEAKSKKENAEKTGYELPRRRRIGRRVVRTAGAAGAKLPVVTDDPSDAALSGTAESKAAEFKTADSESAESNAFESEAESKKNNAVSAKVPEKRKPARKMQSKADKEREKRLESIAAQFFTDSGMEMPDVEKRETNCTSRGTASAASDAKSAAKSAAKSSSADDSSENAVSVNAFSVNAALEKASMQRNSKHRTSLQKTSEQKTSVQKSSLQNEPALKTDISARDEKENRRNRASVKADFGQMLFSSGNSERESAVRGGKKPMMSLLFQEPVIPSSSRGSGSRSVVSSIADSNNSEAAKSQFLTNEDSAGSDSRTDTRRSAESGLNASAGKFGSFGRKNRYDDRKTVDFSYSKTRSRKKTDSEQARFNNVPDEEELRLRRELAEKNAREAQETRPERMARLESDFSEEFRNRKGRRLNAQERRAAAEVGKIENDLRLDDITYSPIAKRSFDKTFANQTDSVKTDSSDLSDMNSAAGISFRRRNRSARADISGRADNSGAADKKAGRNARIEPRKSAFAKDVNSDLTEESSADSNVMYRRHRSQRISIDTDSEETSVVSRRRRRHRSGKTDSDPMLRSRKQQYIDEITDIEGSTRLEAKRQRRRDNRRDRARQSLITEQDFLARREVVNRFMVVREKEKHTQISVIEDDILVEHYISDIDEVSAVGNIYLGRVQNVLPSMEAAFVDIGQMRNGVLYAGEVNWDTTRLEGKPGRIELALKSGDPVLVQVTKDPIGHKGARLTSQITLAGRFLVLVPSGGMTGVSRKLPERERNRLKSIVTKIAPADMGVIIRTAAEGASEEAVEKDLELLMKQWKNIENKQKEYKRGRKPLLLQSEPDVAIRVVRDIFNEDFSKLMVQGDRVWEHISSYMEDFAPELAGRLEKWDPEEHRGKDVFDKWQIDSQLRKGMERKVYLPSGGSLVIDRTEAMTTVDVNTGRYIGKGKSLEETVTRCNLEAAEEIVRQLRLRDIGGMIMIDFVDMVLSSNRDLVLRRLVECLARDRTKHQVAEVTSLGLVQMTRKRVGQGLVEAFSEECPTCRGRGFILHDEPIISANFGDPYALKGGDPFIKTNKHNRGTVISSRAEKPARTAVSTGSSDAVKKKLARIAAAAEKVHDAPGNKSERKTLRQETDSAAGSAPDSSAGSSAGSAVQSEAEFAAQTETQTQAQPAADSAVNPASDSASDVNSASDENASAEE